MVFYLYDCISSVLISTIGALAYVWFWSKKWEDLISFKAAKCVVLGAFAGLVYYFMRLQWNTPDLVITAMVGWFASDFLSAMSRKIKQILGIGNDSLEVK